MGLSPAVLQAHVDHWQQELTRGNRRYRRHWPSRLFRHEAVENAALILRSGQLLSRVDSEGLRALDIAPAEIIQRRLAAHQYVRLYFRPKSPTQYRIEGVRKRQEIYQGRHAPVLVIFIFKAMDILGEPDVRFSNGNMQSPSTREGSTDRDFQAIPFGFVYHDGAYDRSTDASQEIRRCRCAEVLVPSPMALEGRLQAVLCRSPAERATLLHMLGDHAAAWSDRVRTFSEPGLFENTYAYVDGIDGTDKGVFFTLHPRRDGAEIKTEVWLQDENGAVILHAGPSEISASHPWQVGEGLGPGAYTVRIHLEDCLACEASILIDDLPF